MKRPLILLAVSLALLGGCHRREARETTATAPSTQGFENFAVAERNAAAAHRTAAGHEAPAPQPATRVASDGQHPSGAPAPAQHK